MLSYIGQLVNPGSLFSKEQIHFLANTFDGLLGPEGLWIGLAQVYEASKQAHKFHSVHKHLVHSQVAAFWAAHLHLSCVFEVSYGKLSFFWISFYQRKE